MSKVISENIEIVGPSYIMTHITLHNKAMLLSASALYLAHSELRKCGVLREGVNKKPKTVTWLSIMVFQKRYEGRGWGKEGLIYECSLG